MNWEWICTFDSSILFTSQTLVIDFEKKKTREKIVPYGYKCMWCAISMIEWFTTSQYQVLVYLVNIEIYAQDLAKFA